MARLESLSVTLQRYAPGEVDAYLDVARAALVGKTAGERTSMESEAVANHLLVYTSGPRAEWLTASTYMAIIRLGASAGEDSPVMVIAMVRKPGDKNLGTLFAMTAGMHSEGGRFSSAAFALAARALARDVVEAGMGLASTKGSMGSGGVFSTQLFSRCFVDEYQRAFNEARADAAPPLPSLAVRAKLEMHMRLYVVTSATSCPPPKGGVSDGVLRMAGTCDGDDALVAKWMVGFVADCFEGGEPLPMEAALKMARSGIARGATYLWCLRRRPARDGEAVDAGDVGSDESSGGHDALAGTPVSMGECRGHTPHGARLGMIYTPPEHRGRGYGSCLTHGINTNLLTRHGKSFVCLYTDMANPVSNSIYQSVGYRAVTDFEDLGLYPKADAAAADAAGAAAAAADAAKDVAAPDASASGCGCKDAASGGAGKGVCYE